MGKTRTAFVGEEIKEKTTKKRDLPAGRQGKKRSLRDVRGVRVPGLKGGERVVAVTAELPPEEAAGLQKIKEKERKVKRRGRQYLQARTLVDPTKLYPVPEAIELAKKSSYSHFDGKLELHLNLTRKGKFEAALPYPTGAGEQTAVILQTEKQAPLLHTLVGKVTDPTSNLAENIKAIFTKIGERNIKKAVLKATMGPGIKISVI